MLSKIRLKIGVPLQFCSSMAETHTEVQLEVYLSPQVKILRKNLCNEKIKEDNIHLNIRISPLSVKLQNLSHMKLL